MYVGKQMDQMYWCRRWTFVMCMTGRKGLHVNFQYQMMNDCKNSLVLLSIVFFSMIKLT